MAAARRHKRAAVLRHETGWGIADDGGGAGEGGGFEAREGSRIGGIPANTSKMEMRRRERSKDAARFAGAGESSYAVMAQKEAV